MYIRHQRQSRIPLPTLPPQPVQPVALHPVWALLLRKIIASLPIALPAISLPALFVILTYPIPLAIRSAILLELLSLVPFILLIFTFLNCLSTNQSYASVNHLSLVLNPPRPNRFCGCAR